MKKHKLIVRMVILVLLAGGLFAVYRTIYSAADGTIQVAAAPKTKVVTVQQIPVDDTYADFTYPDTFTQLQADPVVNPVLSRYSFVKRQIGAWEVSVQISHLGSGSLNDDSGYNLRDVTPTRFQRQERTIGGNNVVIFSDTSADSFSKVGYLKHGDKSASISFIGNDSADDHIQTDFNTMLASWHWK